MRGSHFICPGLILLTWAVYWPTVGFDFVLLDDQNYVAWFPRVLKGLSYENVVWAFTTTYFSNWHPLTWLSYMLDAQLCGTAAGCFHMTNVVWHTANVVLLFVVLKQLTRATWRSAFVAALFAVHPLHVESVAWISERKDVLSTFFGLAAIGAYGKYCRNQSLRWYLMALAAFVCSLMSKQTLVTLPFLLLLLDYWPLNRIKGRAAEPSATSDELQNKSLADGEHAGSACLPRPWHRLVLEKTPFFCLSALFCVVAVVAQRESGEMPSLEELPVQSRFANTLVVYVLYIKKTLWPCDLAVFYPHPKGTLSVSAVAGAAVVLLLATSAVIASARRRPYLLVGWFWYLGSLVPMLGLVQVGMQQMADRYSYIPLIGLFLLATWQVWSFRPTGTWNRIVLPIMALTLLAVLTARARVQVGYWRDSTTLFARALEVTGSNAFLHYSLGSALKIAGRLDIAIEHLQQAVEIESKAIYHEALGGALLNKGLPEQAIPHFKEAIKLDSMYVAAYNKYGLALYELGKHIEAISQFQQALNIQPDYFLAHYGWGLALQDLGDVNRAIYHFSQAVTINPEYLPAYSMWGIVLYKQGRHDEAISVFKKALMVDPEYTLARKNLDNILRYRGRAENAVRD